MRSKSIDWKKLLDLDSIYRKLTTPGKLYKLDYNYCNKLVLASGYNDKFNYFTGGNCIVVDIPKIVQYRLQNETQRHRR